MLRVRQEGGGDRRICAHGQLALLIHGAPGAPSEAHTTTSDVTGECAAPLPSPGSLKTKREELWLYGSTVQLEVRDEGRHGLLSAWARRMCTNNNKRETGEGGARHR